jgi:hypothetical protein
MQTASPPAAPDAGASADAAAVIAAARARAQRRRRRTALATGIVAAAVGGGGLIAAGVFSGSRPVMRVGPQRPAPVAARTGRVTGYIDACEAVGLPRARHAAGTVTALRGRLTWKDDGRGTYQPRLPTTAAARQRVAAGHTFSFDLAAGQYVLVARGGDLSFIDATVTAGRVLYQDLPNRCK